MRYKGRFDAKILDALQQGYELLVYSEGSLIDDALFYNEELDVYILCLEAYMNCWMSDYRVYIECGNGGKEIIKHWDEHEKAKEHMWD